MAYLTHAKDASLTCLVWVLGLLGDTILDAFLLAGDLIDHQHRHLAMHFTGRVTGKVTEGWFVSSDNELGLQGVTEGLLDWTM